jgi:hypothetical protein
VLVVATDPVDLETVTAAIPSSLQVQLDAMQSLP